MDREGADGGGRIDADNKPRGWEIKSRNLSNEKGLQTRRHSANSLQSRILLFHKLNQGEMLSENSTNGDLKNHVGRGGRV